MLKAGVVSVTFRDYKADEVIDFTKKAGLNAIEWSENWHIKAGDLKEAKRIKTLMDGSGLLVAAYGSYFKLSLGMDIRKSLDTAASLGAKTVRIWGGDRASHLLSQEDRENMAKEGVRVSEIAEKYGINLALEWHRNTITDTNESAISFLDAVNRPNFLTLWQPTPALSIEERSKGLSMIQNRLVNLHVYYWDGDIRLPLKDGEKYWKRYLSNVVGDHYALIEFVQNWSIEQFYEDAKVLSNWLNGFSV